MLHPLGVGGEHAGAVEADHAALGLVLRPAHHVRVLGREVGEEGGLGGVVPLAHPADQRPVVVRLAVVAPRPRNTQEPDVGRRVGVAVAALEPADK